MAVLSLVTLAIISLRPSPPRADLKLWVFASTHADAFRPLLPDFEKATGLSVDLTLLSNRAESVRLMSMFMSGRVGPEVPDVCAVEIGFVGPYLRVPASEVGFLPLNDYLEKSGWMKRILPTQFKTWSKDGLIFGVPPGIHPVGISYREDLFREAGVDLPSATTWVEFQEKCLAFQKYWRAHGHPNRHALELRPVDPLHLVLLLLQRRINLVDANNQINIADPKVAETVAFYAQLVEGPRKIASDSGSGMAGFATDAKEGNICAFLTPDWRVAYMRSLVPEISGKVRLMPLPKFEPSDAPTSAMGGTMISIPKASKRPDDAWKLIEYLILSERGLYATRGTNVVPAIMEFWDNPVFHRPEPYYGGQKVNELYVQLAPQIPRRSVTPVSKLAEAELSVVLSKAVKYLKQHGETGLREACQGWLDEAARNLKKRIEHEDFNK
jgi:ABC-type glycerol-3-phosphate transport system substrate-binding protein